MLKKYYCQFLFAAIFITGFVSVDKISAQESMIQRVDVKSKRNNLYNVFAEAGYNRPYTDVQSPQNGKIVGLGVSYSPISYVQVVANFQIGRLKEGKAKKPYPLMNYYNKYSYVSTVARLAPLKIFKRPDEPFVKFLDAYVGMGAALIFSNVNAAPISEANYGYIDNYKGAGLLIPFEIGYTLPIYTLGNKQQFSVNVNYRNHFISFTDKLDGYKPIVEANKKNDIYNQLTFGVVYSF